jgi:hypothetical protein
MAHREQAGAESGLTVDAELAVSGQIGLSAHTQPTSTAGSGTFGPSPVRAGAGTMRAARLPLEGGVMDWATAAVLIALIVAAMVVASTYISTRKG